MEGRFIVLEGGEGSGKSTLMKELQKRFPEAVFTRDPGGSDVSEEIREVILKDRDKNIDVLTELHLYLAARREHYLRIIKPALEEGKDVFCDRFVLSSMAYQSRSGLDQEYILESSRIATNFQDPDFNFYLDVPVEVGLERISDREGNNRLDKQPIQFYYDIEEAYSKANEIMGSIILDGQRDVETIADEICEKIKEG